MSSQRPLILIADCGATSVKWALCGPGAEPRRFATPGVNLALTGREALATGWREALATALGAQAEGVGEVHCYAAGCVSEAAGAPAREALAAALPGARISVADDLLGAARALLGRRPGVAGIIGTGAACGVYDPVRGITRRMPSGGYIIGDEGSGASMGIELLRRWCKGRLTPPLAAAFAAAYPGLDYPGVVAQVYRGEAPSRYLASFVPLLAANIHLPEAHHIVASRLDAFASAFVAPLLTPGTHTPVALAGSVAAAFADILTDVFASRASSAILVPPVADPLAGLIDYHQSAI